MKAKLYYLVTIFIAILSASTMASTVVCPQFETALEVALKKVTTRETAKKEASAWLKPEAQNYKAKYGKEAISDSGNRDFMKAMDADKGLKTSDSVLYFNVENSVQKKLNDSLIGDKGMVDAINNSFMEKFHKNLKDYPEVMDRLKNNYKGYKDVNLRLTLKSGDNVEEFETKLNAIYQKANREFVSEFEKDGLTKLLPPRTDEVPDVSTWFLSGMGESAQEANKGAREARLMGFSFGNATTVNFKKRIDSIHSDITSIEALRKVMSKDSILLKSGIMMQTSEGVILPSKNMIGVLRKIRPADCENAVEYAAKIRGKVKELYGVDISDKHIDELTKYFEKVDTLSPPIFQRERVVVDLGEAKAGIVSVDFTGVGVDNAFEQMKGLALVNYAQADKKLMLKDAFSKVQNYVDGVTEDINKAKRAFTTASASSKESAVPLFSGDDGILMPKSGWEQTQKVDLVKKLSNTEDPSKYRVTFVKTEYSSGGAVAVAERSQRVVRAETIEKSLRESVIGVGKISSERAKKMIFAIDSQPAKEGGKFNLIIGGLRPTDEEKQLIINAFKRSLAEKNNESLGNLIEVYN